MQYRPYTSGYKIIPVIWQMFKGAVSTLVTHKGLIPQVDPNGYVFFCLCKDCMGK